MKLAGITFAAISAAELALSLVSGGVGGRLSSRWPSAVSSTVARGFRSAASGRSPDPKIGARAGHPSHRLPIDTRRPVPVMIKC
jgi:hypothetical protein